jgi:hypothetical protein
MVAVSNFPGRAAEITPFPRKRRDKLFVTSFGGNNSQSVDIGVEKHHLSLSQVR